MFAFTGFVISMIWFGRVAYRDGKRRLQESRATPDRDFSSFIGYSFRTNLKALTITIPLVGAGMLVGLGIWNSTL